MATVLPGSPPAFNPNDVEATVKALCNYLRGFQENTDYLFGQLQKAHIAIEADISELKSSNGRRTR